MEPVGYLINKQEGLSGERGLYYNYILAANGLFIEASSPLITARVQLDDCEIRGLAPMETKLELKYGKIPQHFFDLALDAFLGTPDEEHYFSVIGSDGYSFSIPVQDRNEGSVVYEVEDSVVLELHSHANMSARFSGQDNLDEKGLRLYGVIGRLTTGPEVNLRVGVYGYFNSLEWGDVFDGTLTGAKEFNEWEVLSASGIFCEPEGDGKEPQPSRRRVRRDRGFCGGGLMPPLEW